MKKITLSLLLLLIIMLVPGIILAVEGENVAQIGNVEYETLAEAVQAVPTNNTETTITLLKDVDNGTGFKATSGQNFIIDFSGHTYDASNPLVGSTGTETNGCQLLKGATVTFKNGTLTSKAAAILIQNYSNLTLDDMLVDTTMGKASYTMSNNCGKVNINGNTSIKGNKTAFDMCWAPKVSKGAYEGGTQITINTTGTIEGTIELDVWGEFAEEVKSTLTIKNINHDGKFSIDSRLEKQLNIQGGKFTSEVEKKYLADGYVCKKIDNEYVVGKEKNITVKEVEGGKVTANPTKAISGETITLTVETKEGYKLEKIEITDGVDTLIGTTTFKMLIGDTEVIPVFTKLKTDAEVSNNVDNAEKVESMLIETLKENKELAEAIKDKNVEIKVEVKEKEVTKTEKETIETAVNKKDTDLKVANYIDITITVKDTDNGDSLGKLSTVKETITFTVAVPENLPELAEGYERVFYIVRNHDGEIELLDATEANGELKFESDKFSTYAIAYKDVKKATDTKEDTTDSTIKDDEEIKNVETNNPKTGDNIIMYVSIAIAAVAGIIILKKVNTTKKRKH